MILLLGCWRFTFVKSNKSKQDRHDGSNCPYDK